MSMNNIKVKKGIVLDFEKVDEQSDTKQLIEEQTNQKSSRGRKKKTDINVPAVENKDLVVNLPIEVKTEEKKKGRKKKTEGGTTAPPSSPAVVIQAPAEKEKKKSVNNSEWNQLIKEFKKIPKKGSEEHKKMIEELNKRKEKKKQEK